MHSTAAPLPHRWTWTSGVSVCVLVGAVCAYHMSPSPTHPNTLDTFPSSQRIPQYPKMLFQMPPNTFQIYQKYATECVSLVLVLTPKWNKSAFCNIQCSISSGTIGGPHAHRYAEFQTSISGRSSHSGDCNQNKKNDDFREWERIVWKLKAGHSPASAASASANTLHACLSWTLVSESRCIWIWPDRTFAFSAW